MERCGRAVLPSSRGCPYRDRRLLLVASLVGGVMVVVLFVLAPALIALGAAAVFIGFDILLGDRGLPMIMAGAVFGAAGLVLLGLAVVARAARRIARRLPAALVEAMAAQRSGSPPSRDATAVPAVEPAFPVHAQRREREPSEMLRGDLDDGGDSPQLPLPEPPRVAPPPPAAPPAREVTVVGRYSSGGNAYVMFSDGSIEAETPSGRHRFSSLDELRAFVASGGEKGEPS